MTAAHPTPSASSDVVSVDPDPQAARLIEYLRERDEPCPQCNYNLRNLVSPFCPECGHRLKLTVTLADVYLKAWITLLVAMCCGAGIALVWAMGLLMAGLPPNRLMLVAIILHFAMVPVVVFLLLRRRLFLRQSRTLQWRLAAVGIGAMILSLVIIAMSIE